MIGNLKQILREDWCERYRWRFDDYRLLSRFFASSNHRAKAQTRQSALAALG